MLDGYEGQYETEFEINKLAEQVKAGLEAAGLSVPAATKPVAGHDTVAVLVTEPVGTASSAQL